MRNALFVAHTNTRRAKRAAKMSLVQKIKDIEDEVLWHYIVSFLCRNLYLLALQMARTQKNKATAHHLGLLKAKLAKLKRELLDPVKGSGGGGAGEGMISSLPHTCEINYRYVPTHYIAGFDVTKSGDARVGLIGIIYFI